MFSRFPGLSNMFASNSNHRHYQHGRQVHQNLQNPNNGEASSSPSAPSDNNESYELLWSKAGIHTNNVIVREGRNEASCEVDNSSAIITKISTLYYQKNFSDITLVISGKEYASHRLILCASSDVFQVMLTSANWSEASSTRIELQESKECSDHFEDFLKYLYTGQVNLELANVLHLQTLADKYNVKDLVDISLNFMMTHIPAAAKASKLIGWYQNVTVGGHQLMSEACKNFIKWNFEFVAAAEDFWELDVELLVGILLEDDLVVFDEYSLFQCIDRWVTSQKRKLFPDDPLFEEKMHQLVHESMGCIRFPMMTPRQLADLLLSPLTQKYKEYFMEMMALGVTFHSGLECKLKDLILQLPHREKLFTPRHYSTDKWSACLTVDHFRSVQHYHTKTLVFATPLSCVEKSADKQMEWVVDFYPKGVRFHRFYLIVWQGTLECPEHILRTVRLSIQCKNTDDETEQNLVKVQIGVLIAGVQNGVEHVRQVIKKNYIFSGRDRILNFDDILPYDELVKPPIPTSLDSLNSADHSYFSSHPASEGTTAGQDYSSEHLSPLSKETCFLLRNDSLKIRIVITPLREIKI